MDGGLQHRTPAFPPGLSLTTGVHCITQTSRVSGLTGSTPGTHTPRLLNCIKAFDDNRHDQRRWLWVPAFAGTTRICRTREGDTFARHVGLLLGALFEANGCSYFPVAPSDAQLRIRDDTFGVSPPRS